VLPHSRLQTPARCSGTRCDVRDRCALHTAVMRVAGNIVDYSSLGPVVNRQEACQNFIRNRSNT